MATSIVDAYRKKMSDEDEDRDTSCEVQVVFVKRKHFKLSNLVLDNCSISSTGPLDEVEDICSKVKECVLSRNCFSDWSEVYNLLSAGKNIEFLNLSHNKLEGCCSLLNNQYVALKCLVLYGNNVPWETVLTLLPSLPSLANLNIGQNNITTLPCPDDASFPSLVDLNLIHNNITTFTDITDIGRTFPNLHTLFLSDNPLQSFGDDQQALSNFGNLTKLHVNSVAVTCWDELSKIRWFTSLKDVRMSHWDIFGEMEEEERRRTVCALLPNITLFNGSDIPDRDIAERWYMRKCLNNGDCDSARYRELYEKHGDLPEAEDISLDSDHEVISLLLYVPAKGLQMVRTFSLYDTYKVVLQSLEEELKIPLSLNFMLLHKQPGPTQQSSDVTVYKQDESDYFAMLPDKDIPPGHVLIRDPHQMLYQTCRAVKPLARAQDGDTLVFRRATSAEVTFDAANGTERKFLKRGQGEQVSP